MRSILRVNMASGTCSVESLPERFALLGGRALASMLVASAMAGEGVLDANPLSPANKLAIAPGLLSGGACASSGRTAVACKSPVDGTISRANAGGLPGEALARHGIAAVFVEGSAPPGTWLDLVIGAKGAELAPSTANGVNTYETMARLARQYGGENRIITIGKAGEVCLPMATMAFSDRDGRPTRHAGGGAGAVMGSKGLKAVIIHGDSPPLPMADKNAFQAAAKRFANALLAHRANAGGQVSRKGCAPGCVLACRDGSAGTVKADGAIGKWPDYMTLWSVSSAPGAADYANLDRYAYLCNDLGVDAFVVGEMLAMLVKQGLLERGDAESALDLLEGMSRNPLASELFGHGIANAGPGAGCYDNTEATRRFYREHTEENVILDSLGICRFASEALDQSEDARSALADMLKAGFGLSLCFEDIQAAAREVLRAELAFAHPHACCGDDHED